MWRSYFLHQQIYEIKGRLEMNYAYTYGILDDTIFPRRETHCLVERTKKLFEMRRNRKEFRSASLYVNSFLFLIHMFFYQLHCLLI